MATRNNDLFYALVPDDELQEHELARLMENRVSFILLQSVELSGQIESAIRIGNTMHKTAVLSGLGCLALNFTPLPFKTVVLPLGVASVAAALAYNITWQFDPLCKYQIDANGHELAAVAPSSLPALQPGVTILVRRDDTARKILHNTAAFLAAVVCGLKLRRLW